MRSPSFHFKAPRLAAALLVTIALCAVAIPAQAGLCVITGPDQLCAGQAVLCGPNGPYDYEWTGPGGFTAQTRCVTVTVPGTYTLRLFDFLNGLWVPPCSHDVAGGGDPAPCSITGPNRACTGETVTLCGPAGAFTYRWTGPAGFSDTSRCIAVTAAGDYQLEVADPASGCPPTSCTQSVAFDPCTGAVNCPRSANFWAAQCPQPESFRLRLDDAEIAAVAARVDEMCASLQWTATPDDWCGTLLWTSKLSLEQRARRQFTALASNVAAADLHLTSPPGRPIGLERETRIKGLGKDGMTIGEWMASADAQLVGLRSGTYRESRKVLCRIIAVAWAINNGRNIGPVCTPGGTQALASDMAGVPEPDAADAMADEPMALDPPSPNPFQGSTRIVYELFQDTTEPVEIGIYDIAGRRVQRLTAGPQTMGVHELRWDGRRADGTAAPGGLYFVHGRVGAWRVQSRVLLAR